ncbi:hypothetical protein GCM10009754_88320 [Amycolatopsis minnesotensis]|uniref:Transposase IS4-like domain-containing protein n=1 Tax=Amycolatopsis minnesotensis TaxID=337894 RepID=A0ABN2T048_9PSEU
MTKARQRLGKDPLEELFRRTANPLAEEGGPGFIGDLRVVSFDGKTLPVPDSRLNREHFSSQSHKETAGYPSVRVVSLVESGTHATIDARIGPASTSEQKLVDDMIPSLKQGMLCLADRSFPSIDRFLRAMETRAQLAWRVRNDWILPVVDVLEQGKSYMSVLVDPKKKHNYARRQIQRKRTGNLPSDYDPKELVGTPIRVVEAWVDKPREYPTSDNKKDWHGASGELIRIITTVDPEILTAEEVVALYAQRWEHETAFSYLGPSLVGKDRILRSQSPDMVYQEMWALLLVYNAVCTTMKSVAELHNADPDRASFKTAAVHIRNHLGADSRGDFSPSSQGRQAP